MTAAFATDGLSMRLPGCRKCTGTRQDLPVIEENGFIGYQCSQCHLIYISPRPDPARIVNIYDHDSAHVSAAEHIASSCSPGKALKARLTLRLIRRFGVSGDLLEIGPGGGAFMLAARQEGFRVHAAEFNPAQVTHLQSLGFDCRQGAFAVAFEGLTFDVIYHCDVLSHLFDPVAEFRAMRHMLKPGGVLVFETGNFGDVHSKYFHLVDRWQYPDHLYFFSRLGLENLARVSGFQIEALREYSRELEMRIGKLVAPMKVALIRQQTGPQNPGTAKRQELSDSMSRTRSLAVTIKHILDYFLIYAIGSILPKAHRPLTVIAVLRPE